MIEIFKTNVQEVVQASKLTTLLLEQFPGSRINFDLEDCDKVLRIEGPNFMVRKVMSIVNDNGFSCHILE